MGFATWDSITRQKQEIKKSTKLDLSNAQNGKDVGYMPNINPISDLKNYTEVLKETQEGAPVFLIKTVHQLVKKGMY